MDDTEFNNRITLATTWDQDELDRLVGRRAVSYAQEHEANVRRLCSHMWEVFPFGPRWWRLKRALGDPLFRKNAAIKARAAEIGRQRAEGLIVERYGDLVWRDA